MNKEKQQESEQNRELEQIVFIVFNGYYTKEDDGDQLIPHTNLTHKLYMDGLKACGNLEDDEIYDGVCIEEGKPYAQIDYERYIKI
ncbi:MAG: hypothetical protein ACOCRK_02210 [bacterium]